MKIIRAIFLLSLFHYVYSECHSDDLVVYKVTLHTFWTAESFPKQYPEYRPAAQWSKVLGRSHNQEYKLFSIGKEISDPLKNFVENSVSDYLDEEVQGGGGILDSFQAAPITSGFGLSSSEFFIDGNHTQVSMVARIVPSPDWFVGVDSLNLCQNNNWVDSLTFEADPLDAGTDNGMTFTSPNWPSSPQENVTVITSRFPNHPAGSFYYPELVNLPRIAVFGFTMLKLYKLDKIHSGTDDDLEIIPMEREYVHRELFNEVTYNINIKSPKAQNHIPSEMGGQNSALKGPHTKKKKKKKSKEKFRRKAATRSRDCRVSEWSPWSPCSKTCGIGEAIRTRKIIKPQKGGGRPCPLLRDKKWCGSARDCDHQYFNW